MHFSSVLITTATVKYTDYHKKVFRSLCIKTQHFLMKNSGTINFTCFTTAIKINIKDY